MLKPISKDNFEIILKTIDNFFNLPLSKTFDAAIHENHLDKLRAWEITSFSIPISHYEINDNSLIEFENKYEVYFKNKNLPDYYLNDFTLKERIKYALYKCN